MSLGYSTSYGNLKKNLLIYLRIYFQITGGLLLPVLGDPKNLNTLDVH